MIAERIAEHISMAEAAQNWLRARGSRVVIRRYQRHRLAMPAIQGKTQCLNRLAATG
ncbi:hypothetical protein ACND5R_001893 [Escherichia coli]